MSSNVIELAQALIQYPSITPEDADCQKFLTQQLKRLGFSVTELPCENASNFWAQHGAAKPLFVFAGHTDVVPPGNPESWTSPPFKPTIRDDYLYGRGAADMKGSLAAMFVACEQFLQDYPAYHGSIGWLITSAEEGPSHLGTPIVVDYLRQQGITMDYCLVGEPTCSQQLGDTIKIGRRGSLTGYLTIQGQQGHVAYPHLANNPVHQALSALHELVNYTWDQGTELFDPTTLQIAHMQAGTGATNVIPGELKVDFNLRYSPAITADFIKRTIEHILQQHELNYRVEWEHSAQPYITPAKVLAEFGQRAIQKVNDVAAQLSTSGGTSDGRYIAPTGCEVIEFGPINKTIHQVNECIKIDDLEQLVAIYYHLLVELFMNK